MSVPKIEIEKRRKFVPATIVKYDLKSECYIEIIDKPVRVRTHSKTENIIVAQETREVPGHYAPRRYETKCFLQPKQNPVSYSETVILKLGSSKKNYFETVRYEVKLVPFHWSESITTVTPATGAVLITTKYETFIGATEYHYISLEPQQLAASEGRVFCDGAA